MWAILEKITNTVGSNYDETIRRGIRVFTPKVRLLFKDILEALRHYRNQYVHSGRAGQEPDQMAHIVKSFVEPHLTRLISNPFRCQSFEEYAEFLALPGDIDRLEQRKRMVSLALRLERKANKNG